MQDNPKALLALARKGDAKAQYKLGLAYEIGLGFKKNINQSFVWYQKSAQQNYAKAQYNLAICYALAKGVEKNIEQSKYWVKQAHKNGYSTTNIF